MTIPGNYANACCFLPLVYLHDPKGFLPAAQEHKTAVQEVRPPDSMFGIFNAPVINVYAA